MPCNGGIGRCSILRPSLPHVSRWTGFFFGEVSRKSLSSMPGRKSCGGRSIEHRPMPSLQGNTTLKRDCPELAQNNRPNPTGARRNTHWKNGGGGGGGGNKWRSYHIPRTHPDAECLHKQSETKPTAQANFAHTGSAHVTTDQANPPFTLSAVGSSTSATGAAPS